MIVEFGPRPAWIHGPNPKIVAEGRAGVSRAG